MDFGAAAFANAQQGGGRSGLQSRQVAMLQKQLNNDLRESSGGGGGAGASLHAKEQQEEEERQRRRQLLKNAAAAAAAPEDMAKEMEDVPTSVEHTELVIAWMFNSAQSKPPKEAPPRMFVQRPTDNGNNDDVSGGIDNGDKDGSLAPLEGGNITTVSAIGGGGSSSSSSRGNNALLLRSLSPEVNEDDEDDNDDAQSGVFSVGSADLGRSGGGHHRRAPSSRMETPAARAAACHQRHATWRSSSRPA